MHRRCCHAAGHHQVELEERQPAGMAHAQVIASMAPVALSVASSLIRFTTAGAGALSIRPLTKDVIRPTADDTNGRAEQGRLPIVMGGRVTTECIDLRNDR